MFSHQFAYLILALLFLAGWLFLYLRRKDERRELLVLSFPMATFGVAADLLYVRDWWNPLTVLGSAPVSGEALIASFGIVGVGSVLPEYLLRLRTTSPGKIFTRHELAVFCTTFFTMAALFYGSFFLLSANSLVATVLTLIVPTVFMWGRRMDLLWVGLANGGFMVAFSALVYTGVTYLAPGWIDSFYLFENTPALVLLNVPIDDIVFYFCSGVFFGTFYEWWQNVRRVPLRKGHRSIGKW